MLQTILVGIVICRPTEMNWNPWTPGGWCGNEMAAFASVGAVDVINELCILILPIPYICKLQMKTRYKLGLGCIFGAGIVYVLICFYFICSMIVVVADSVYTGPLY